MLPTLSDLLGPLVPPGGQGSGSGEWRQPMVIGALGGFVVALLIVFLIKGAARQIER